MITLSYYFAGTPIITGLLLCANLLVIVWDYQKLLPLLNISISPANNPILINREIETNKLWVYLGTVLFLFTIFYVPFFERTPMYWFLTSVILGLVGLIFKEKNTAESTF